MVPDPYTLEKMALAHRQKLQREAEHEQMLGELPTHSSFRMRYMAARLGIFLIALGTRLRQLEQPRTSIAVDEVRLKESLYCCQILVKTLHMSCQQLAWKADGLSASYMNQQQSL